jgi:hypothetical protein
LFIILERVGVVLSFSPLQPLALQRSKQRGVANMRLKIYLTLSTYAYISGFGREVAENRPLLGYYAASSGNFLQTFRDNLSVPSSKIGKKLPLLAA